MSNNNNSTSIDSHNNGGQLRVGRRKRGPRRRSANSNTESISVSTHKGGITVVERDVHPVVRSSNRRTNRGPTGNSTSSMSAGPPRNVGPPGRSRAQFNRLAERVREIVRAFVDPRGCPDFVYPDGSSNVFRYQSKTTTKLLGANAPPAPSDAGRFAIVYNPIVNNLIAGINTVTPQFQLGVIDVGTAGAAWPGRYIPTATNDRCIYTVDPNIAVWANSQGTGTMDKAKIAGSCMLLSFDGDNIAGGGDLSAVCLPGTSYYKQLQTGAAGANNLVQWENLAEYPKSYTGRLVKGTYVWWRPDNINDMFLRSVQSQSGDTMDTYSYPVLFSSGIIAQNTTNKNGLLVNCYTNFNATHANRTQVGENADDDMEAIAIAFMYMKRLDTAMPNDVHDKWINAVIGGIAGFITAGPIGAALGVLGGLGLTGAVGAIGSAKLFK